jgi:hypothetical protein
MALLEKLAPLVGDWRMESSVDGVPVLRGTTRFAWHEDGAFLIQRASADPPLPTTPKLWIDNSPFPIVAIVGADDPSHTFYLAYSDGRGVHRVYQMSMANGVWRFWGQAGPDFHQRFEGRFSADGNTITARVEQSRDGNVWETDFDTIYWRS